MTRRSSQVLVRRIQVAQSALERHSAAVKCAKNAQKLSGTVPSGHGKWLVKVGPTSSDLH
jgi:hypothetical protein